MYELSPNSAVPISSMAHFSTFNVIVLVFIAHSFTILVQSDHFNKPFPAVVKRFISKNLPSTKQQTEVSNWLVNIVEHSAVKVLDRRVNIYHVARTPNSY